MFRRLFCAPSLQPLWISVSEALSEDPAVEWVNPEKVEFPDELDAIFGQDTTMASSLAVAWDEADKVDIDVNCQTASKSSVENHVLSGSRHDETFGKNLAYYDNYITGRVVDEYGENDNHFCDWIGYDKSSWTKETDSSSQSSERLFLSEFKKPQVDRIYQTKACSNKIYKRTPDDLFKSAKSHKSVTLTAIPECEETEDETTRSITSVDKEVVDSVVSPNASIRNAENSDAMLFQNTESDFGHSLSLTGESASFGLESKHSSSWESWDQWTEEISELAPKECSQIDESDSEMSHHKENTSIKFAVEPCNRNDLCCQQAAKRDKCNCRYVKLHNNVNIDDNEVGPISFYSLEWSSVMDNQTESNEEDCDDENCDTTSTVCSSDVFWPSDCDEFDQVDYDMIENDEKLQNMLGEMRNALDMAMKNIKMTKEEIESRPSLDYYSEEPTSAPVSMDEFKDALSSTSPYSGTNTSFKRRQSDTHENYRSPRSNSNTVEDTYTTESSASMNSRGALRLPKSSTVKLSTSMGETMDFYTDYDSSEVIRHPFLQPGLKSIASSRNNFKTASSCSKKHLVLNELKSGGEYKIPYDLNDWDNKSSVKLC